MARIERAYNMAQNWVKWLDTRHFYAVPEKRNILAMLMKDARPSKGEPDGENSAEMQAFNLAVTNLPSSEFIPFVVIYCELRPQGKPVKVIAHENGTCAQNFYRRADKAAYEILNICDRLVELNSIMRKVVNDGTQ